MLNFYTETKEKSVPRENSTSDSEENSTFKDSDQQSVGDTDNQASSNKLFNFTKGHDLERSSDDVWR